LQVASHFIFCEFDWTPGSMEQAVDRCHRIGQKDSVLAQYLVLRGTLDAHIAKTFVRKASVVGQALDGLEEAVAVSLTEETA
jgi:SWI/SNF-related matrix-associated actin-dependent regulator of chromatin subfamily A-like protein 1